MNVVRPGADPGSGGLGALSEAIEGLHQPEHVYWEAENCPFPDEHAAQHVEARDSNDDICIACPPVHQTCSTCVEYGEHGPESVRYPCPTLAALRAALAEPGGGE